MTLRDRIEEFNAGRDPERLARKFDLLRQSPKTFFRGTAHLFFEALGGLDVPPSPTVWANGDAHLENFGVYRGDNRLVYFDLNDFDEACLAPLAWDLLRFSTSASLLAGPQLVAPALEAYRIELLSGKARWVERDTARGSVARLVLAITGRSRKEFLEKRLTKKARIRKNGKYALPMMEAPPPVDLEAFGFEAIDWARRIAGNGSLGVERYVILARREKDRKQYLLDLKSAQQSALELYSKAPQPVFVHPALRVWKGQRTLQAISPAFLHAVSGASRSFILKELMPREDRVRLDRQTPNLNDLVLIQGKLLAWAHLRASGHDSSCPADALIAFAREFPDKALAKLTKSLAASAQKSFEEFSAPL